MCQAVKASKAPYENEFGKTDLIFFKHDTWLDTFTLDIVTGFQSLK